ncbi:MAG TPA: SiaB family protein kinase [Bacteroidia bacterium]|jgi:hypothetical protein|nr:SiaB family protein kinase [Bacteroidia bacterium]
MDIHDFYDKMDRNNILLSFKGDITAELLTSILQIIESKMDNMQEEPKLKKKVYIVLVELLQNLYHHMDDPSQEGEASEVARTAIFMIGKENSHYNVITGNYIKNDKMTGLKKKMDEINSLPPEELKEHYKRILNNGQMSDKGGGGLGMIDIARRTGKPLFYEFTPINDVYSFFTLNVVIEQ